MGDTTLRHHCVYGCCGSERDCLEHFKTYVVWALLPGKIPVYSRKSWVGYDRAIDAVAILECHHGLFSRMMQKYVGRPTASPGAHDGQLAAPSHGWLDALEAEASAHSGEASVPAAPVQPQGEAHADDAGESGNPEDFWAAFNRQKKQDVRSWYGTKPGHRLLLLKEMLSVTLGLMNHFLFVGSKRWEDQQVLKSARQQQRDFVIVSAAMGQEVSSAMTALKMSLQRPMRAIPVGTVQAQLGSLRFRLCSAALSATHVLIRIPRDGLPLCRVCVAAGGRRSSRSGMAQSLSDSPLPMGYGLHDASRTLSHGRGLAVKRLPFHPAMHG